eukprot:1355353-Alexandrium_andersonii.AAC.1
MPACRAEIFARALGRGVADSASLSEFWRAARTSYLARSASGSLCHRSGNCLSFCVYCPGASADPAVDSCWKTFQAL